MKRETDSLNEINTYFYINELGGFIWRMNREYYHDRISNSDWIKISEDIKRSSELQIYIISNLMKFGVNKPFIDEENKL